MLHFQELSNGAEDLELKGSIFREVNSAVMLTAMRHGGYQTLWDMCYDLSDAVLLRNLMVLSQLHSIPIIPTRSE